MTLNITISDELAAALTRSAAATGKTLEEIAVSAIRRDLQAAARLRDALTPIRSAFSDSGLSEDEAVELFESEKHALRRERAAANG